MTTKRDRIRELGGSYSEDTIAALVGCSVDYVRKTLKIPAPATETRGRPRKTRCTHCHGTGYEPSAAQSRDASAPARP